MLVYIDLIQEEEKEKYGEGYIPPSKEHPAGNPVPRASNGKSPPPPPPIPSSTKPPRSPAQASLPTPAPTNFSSPWPCDICTLVNPSTYLVCDACGTERPSPPSSPHLQPTIPHHPTKTSKPPKSNPLIKKSALENLRIIEEQAKKVPEKPMGWVCGRCGNWMESMWWTCAECGGMKNSS